MLHVCYFGPTMQVPSGFGSRSPGTHQAPSSERPPGARQQASSPQGGRSCPGFKSPTKCQPYFVVSREGKIKRERWKGVERGVTRAKIYCPEACIVPRGRWHCPRGRGLCFPKHCLCHSEGLLHGASYSLVRGGGWYPYVHFGLRIWASSRYCS